MRTNEDLTEELLGLRDSNRRYSEITTELRNENEDLKKELKKLNTLLDIAVAALEKK